MSPVMLPSNLPDGSLSSPQPDSARAPTSANPKIRILRMTPPSVAECIGGNCFIGGQSEICSTATGPDEKPAAGKTRRPARDSVLRAQPQLNPSSSSSRHSAWKVPVIVMSFVPSVAVMLMEPFTPPVPDEVIVTEPPSNTYVSLPESMKIAPVKSS